jgi:hypothetical protein
LWCNQSGNFSQIWPQAKYENKLFEPFGGGGGGVLNFKMYKNLTFFLNFGLILAIAILIF